jgi:hypothetical protein
MSKPREVPAVPAPHSWPADQWPAHVFPGEPGKGKYLVRAHQDELVAAGALVRLGRNRVVIGAPFCRWLASKGDKVAGFQIAANRRRTADQVAA